MLLLCQVQLAQGKPQSALRSVQSARQAMPAAADIHTLWCLMKQQPALSAVGASLPAPARAQQQMDQQRGGRSSRGLQGSQGGAGVQGDTQGPGGWWDGADNLEGSAGEPAAPVHAYRDACSAAVHVDPLNWGALEGEVAWGAGGGAPCTMARQQGSDSLTHDISSVVLFASQLPYRCGSMLPCPCSWSGSCNCVPHNRGLA